MKNGKKRILNSSFVTKLIIIILFIILYNINFSFHYNYNRNDFLKKINYYYKLNKFVNINLIETMIYNGRTWKINLNKSNEINIGFQLDPKYVLRVMMTLASIMDSQKPMVRLRFHFAVVLSFTIKDMLKIYSLRDKIRNDVEFNFYNAERVETDLKGLNTKGPGAVAKLLLPELLPDDIERLIVFYTGDLLVLRDLTKMYNWNMGDYLYLGIPGGKVGKKALITKKKYKKYINTGSILINVKKVKISNIYKECVKHKDQYYNHVGDQDLLNDIAFGKVGYLPIKFGACSPYKTDKDSDKLIYKIPNRRLISFYLKSNYTYIPKEYIKIIQLFYNPIIIHQFNGKWMKGLGMTVYRRLAQYYIRLAGIWDEMCNDIPAYCKK